MYYFFVKKKQGVSPVIGKRIFILLQSDKNLSLLDHLFFLLSGTPIKKIINSSIDAKTIDF